MPAGSVAVKERHQPRVLVETAGLSEEEWLAYRQKGIGGSDVAALLGISPWRTARDLFYDKLNIAVVEDHEDNWVALEMGHLLEPLVAKIFQHRTGYKIYQIKKMFQHPKYPWMLADVDYFVELPDGTTAILEIKTTNYNAKDNWWLDGEETIPAYYESQGRHYMAVMDVDRCFFCCLYGNNEQESIIRDMQRDLAYEDEMIFLEQNFWENHVLTRTPPPYTEDGDLVIESVRRYTGPADKEAPAVSLDLPLTAKLMRFLQLQEQKKGAEAGKKEIEEDMKRLKAAIIAKMGKSCKAICQQDGVNYAELFTEQMLRSRAAIPLRRWLMRYQALTGTEYIEYFNERHWHTLRSFALLVERKEIDLWQFFEQHKEDGTRAHPLELLQEYALKISSWRCYRFAQKLFGQYAFPQLRKIFGKDFYFHQKFAKTEGFYHKKVQAFSMVRPFLTVEQHRQLYDWIDASFFQTEPESYDSFVLCALKTQEVQHIYEKPLLAAVLRQLLARDACNGYEAEQLKERFYSKEEMEAERKAAAEQEELEKERQRQQEVMERQEKLARCYDGSAESLLQFMRGYYYGETRKAALDMVYEKLLEWPAGCAQTLAAQEMQKFFELCGGLVIYEPRPRREILTMVQTIVGGEAA